MLLGVTGPTPAHLLPKKDGRDLLAGALAYGRLTGNGTPASRSMRVYEPNPKLNQVGSSCTAHAGASATCIVTTKAGAPVIPSPRLGYDLDRLNGAPGQPLVDNGSTLGDYVAACNRWGFVPMAAGLVTDITAENINQPPSLADLVGASHRVLVGEYGVDLTTATAIDTVIGLLGQDVPLYVAGFVDTAFAQYVAGGVPVGPPNEADPNGGGHAMVITGYATQPDGSVLFEVLSSWGAGFGDNGHAWTTSSWLLALWECWAWTVKELDS